MINLYRTDEKILSEISEYADDIWVSMTKPTVEESKLIAEKYDIDLADVRAALDDEESSRIEVEDNYTLIIVDIPSIEIRNDREAYTTIPLGIILVGSAIITVCAENTPVLEAFVEKKVREFSTKKRMRFTYQILYRSCMTYQYYLRVMDRRRTLIEQRIQEETEDTDLIDLHELESNLVYFATSLRANGVVLDKLTRYSSIKQYPEDKELLDDVMVENKQAIEMTNIYRDIINGTRELMTTIINNRLNNVMKFLAAITIVMAIPTIISGIYGMNVDGKWMPLAKTPYGFEIICGIILVICIIIALVLKKKKMLKM
ncbi:MAG: magnesium transporter CorA family protein [Coprococcus sp.]|nr:magnesium transporter CorA family protein [Coprococcus sp.]